jgi:hypothetical protein
MFLVVIGNVKTRTSGNKNGKKLWNMNSLTFNAGSNTEINNLLYPDSTKN